MNDKCAQLLKNECCSHLVVTLVNSTVNVMITLKTCHLIINYTLEERRLVTNGITVMMFITICSSDK